MNSNEPQRYQEINLVDLIWYICSRWRLLIVAMLLFSLLAGCYQVYKNIANNAAADKQMSELEEEKKEEEEAEDRKRNVSYDSLTPTEAAAVDNAAIYAGQLQMFLKYQEDSVYVNLDPYNVNVQIVNYIVQVDKDEIAEDGMDANALADLLKQSYVSFINSGAAAGKLMEVYEGIEQTAIVELVSAENLNSITDSSSFQEGSFTSQGSTTTFRVDSDSSINRTYALFRVRVLGSSEKDADRLAKALDKVLKDYSVTLTKTLDQHTIKLSDSISSVIVDGGVLSARQNLQANLINSRTNLNNTLAAFTDEQKSAYQKLTGNRVDAVITEQSGDETENAEDESELLLLTKVSLTSGLVKYILLGLFGGLMLAAVFVAMTYVLVPTLKTTDDITRCFNYYLMADLSCYQKLPKRFGSGIDQFIHKLRYRDSLTLEEEQRLLATNLKVTCRNEGVSSVYLTSSYHMTDEEAGIIQKLIDALKKENIKAVYGGSIERDAESYERMTDTGAVVYVEKLGKSRFNSLENIDAMTARQGVKILGVVAM